MSFAIDKIFNLIKPKKNDENDSRAKNNFKKLVSSNGFYERVCDEFTENDFECSTLDNVELNEDDKENIKDELKESNEDSTGA